MMRTFDGRSYKFGMKCHYILAMTASDTYEDTLADWKVSVQTENCDKIDTCKKTVVIDLPNRVILGSGRDVSVNGVVIDAGKAFIERDSGLEVQRDQEYTYVSTSIGVKVKWSTGTDVFVTVERATHLNNVMGLCGNYNNNPADDFTPFGETPTNDVNFQLFLRSFQTGDDTCSETLSFDACGGSARSNAASLRCRLPLNNPAFEAAIIAGIEPEWYIQACMYDFCSLNGENPEDDERVVCHYLTAYAMEAAKNGIRLELASPRPM